MSIKEKLKNLRLSGLSFCVFRFPEEDHLHLVVHRGSTYTPLEKGMIIHPFSTAEADIHHLGNVFIGLLEDWELQLGASNQEGTPSDLSPRRMMTHDEYLEKCTSALEKLRSGALDKVVLNVIKEFRNQKKPEDLFVRALSLYPEAFVHWTYIHHGISWLGASPELLLKREGHDWETMSLAGTKVQGDGAMGAKEIEEQDIVTSYITRTLMDQGVHSLVVSSQSEKKAGHLIHLCNQIRFTSTLKDEVLLNVLHPTPAVCGYPKESAIDTLTELEMMGRDYYCGYIGLKEDHRSAYYVNLRCMELRDDKAYVFVGGGITASSDPQKEWEEMNQKARTMGRILE